MVARVLQPTASKIDSGVGAMQQRKILLSLVLRSDLLRLRDTAAKAYLRERAAAILKVADGIPALVVARERLLRPRDPDTVYDWLNRFEKEGIPGLVIRPGRGRKPVFSPSVPEA
jgi:transposase